MNNINIRPITDKFKELIFSILSFNTLKVFVLDLFSGSGSFGIESIAKGAKKTFFVDFKVANIIQNPLFLKLRSKAIVLDSNILNNLNSVDFICDFFKIVFIDPPYDIGSLNRTLINLLKLKSLSSGAFLIIKHSSKEQVIDNLLGFTLLDRRFYGETIITFMILL